VFEVFEPMYGPGIERMTKKSDEKEEEMDVG
jgi:hypothetical protein